MGKKKRKIKMNFFSLLIVLCVAVVPFVSKATQEVVPTSREQVHYTFAPVVKKVAPAVVNIYAARVIEARRVNPFFQDPIFRHFFGDGLPGRGGRVQSSLGSGVIVHPSGIVITNYHVIKAAQEIKVVLHDGREMTAEVVVQDKRTDLVALQLKTDGGLPYLKLRDADSLKVGDMVLAFGNPFGFGHTVTSGIVSGLARSQLGVNDFRSFIQTDAAINPGNSGGPLVTLDGRLVGINTAIFSNTGGSIGISFAVPSNLVAPVIASVGQGNKRVIRPWIGVRTQSITNEMKESLGLEKATGVLVQKVFKGGSAEKAKIIQGDVILAVNGHDITNESSFKFRMATLQVGKEAVFTLWRDEKQEKVDVKLVAPPDITDNRRVEVTGRNPLSGAMITGLSPSVAEDYAISYEEGGAVIYKIRNGSLARLNGLLPGDVITKINGKEIKKVEQVLRYLSRSRDGWKIEYRRGGRVQSLFVQTW